MISIIQKAVLFEGKVSVTALDVVPVVQTAVDRHHLSDTAGVVLGRALTVACYISSNIKMDKETVTVLFDGGGGIGKVITKSQAGLKVRGLVDNPTYNCDMHKGARQSVREAVGTDGDLTVIRDLGMKEPYVGKCAIVNGEIADDFAYYYTASQQTPTAIALYTDVKGGVVKCSKGIIVQLLPNCDDAIVTIMEDIMRNFVHLENLVDSTPKQLIDDYFGQFEVIYLDESEPEFKCTCSREFADALVKSLGREEAFDILREEGRINVNCEFCNTDYSYTLQDVFKLFDTK